MSVGGREVGEGGGDGVPVDGRTSGDMDGVGNDIVGEAGTGVAVRAERLQANAAIGNKTMAINKRDFSW